jgi:predicted metalloprotease
LTIQKLVIAGMLANPAMLAAAEGNVWSYEDSEGVTHFSNVPDNARYRLYLKPLKVTV